MHCPATQAALAEGMESLSQAKVGSALQVLFNLEELKQVGGGGRRGGQEEGGRDMWKGVCVCV